LFELGVELDHSRGDARRSSRSPLRLWLDMWRSAGVAACLAWRETRRGAIVFRVEPTRGAVTTLFTDIEGSTWLLRVLVSDRVETLLAS